jgi:hypothetical protein
VKCICGGTLTKKFGLIDIITGEKKYPFIQCSNNRIHDEVSIHDFFDKCEKAEAQVTDLEKRIEVAIELINMHGFKDDSGILGAVKKVLVKP